MKARAVYLCFDGWRKINIRSATEGENRGSPLQNPHRDESSQVDASHLEVGVIALASFRCRALLNRLWMMKTGSSHG